MKKRGKSAQNEPHTNHTLPKFISKGHAELKNPKKEKYRIQVLDFHNRTGGFCNTNSIFKTENLYSPQLERELDNLLESNCSKLLDRIREDETG